MFLYYCFCRNIPRPVDIVGLDQLSLDDYYCLWLYIISGSFSHLLASTYKLWGVNSELSVMLVPPPHNNIVR